MKTPRQSSNETNSRNATLTQRQKKKEIENVENRGERWQMLGKAALYGSQK